MKKTIGIVCMIVGILLIASAALMLFQNQREARQAQLAVEAVMPQLVEKIQQARSTDEPYREDTVPMAYPAPYDTEMTQAEIDGYAYVGFVAIPALGLELPVMADWDYDRLKISPCRYAGSYKADDLVIMAHSYARHFRDLDELTAGDTVIFTDMDGIVTQYAVAAVDILTPYAVEEMVSGDYDLTLFTCTYGGGSRITVRCDRADE